MTAPREELVFAVIADGILFVQRSTRWKFDVGVAAFALKLYIAADAFQFHDHGEVSSGTESYREHNAFG